MNLCFLQGWNPYWEDTVKIALPAKDHIAAEIDVILWDESGAGTDATCLGECCLHVSDLVRENGASPAQHTFDLYQYIDGHARVVRYTSPMGQE